MEIYNEDCQTILTDIIANNKNCIIVTDPPFNIGYHYNTYKDNLKEDEYYEVLENILKDNKSVVVHYPEKLYKLSFKLGHFPEKIVSWVYNSSNPRQHRDIAFFGINPNFNQVKQPYKNLNDKRIKNALKKGSQGARIYDWWEIQQVKNVSKEKTKHPCQMPVEVMKRIVGILPYDATIIDPFMGSGTTGVAVELMNKEQNANRNFIGIEIDKEYFDIAKARIDFAMKMADEEKQEEVEQITFFE